MCLDIGKEWDLKSECTPAVRANEKGVYASGFTALTCTYTALHCSPCVCKCAAVRVRETKMEALSLSSECSVTSAGESRPCLFCHFHSQCYIEKCHYSFVTVCWRPGEKWMISRPASACGDSDVQLF